MQYRNQILQEAQIQRSWRSAAILPQNRAFSHWIISAKQHQSLLLDFDQSGKDNNIEGYI